MDGDKVLKKKVRKNLTWKAFMTFTVIYLLVLGAIGYVAFGEQYFNDVDVIAGKFYEIKEKYNLTDEESERLGQVMNSMSESSNSIQALASQSFNITLGALLAFLSSTATLFFQQPKDDEES